MKKLLKTFAPFIAALALDAHALVVFDSFDGGASGWAAAGNSGADGDIRWLPADGNPGGHVGIADVDNGWAYFAAPAAYKAAVLPGGTLGFDLRHASDAGHPDVADARVALVGGGLTLVAELQFQRPGNDWRHFEFGIGEGSAFRVLPSAAEAYDPLARQATAAEWLQVLSSLNSFYISADYSSANTIRGGWEFTELDNVRYQATLAAPVPEPDGLALFGAGLTMLAIALRRRAARCE